jgi:hypothetical protein
MASRAPYRKREQELVARTGIGVFSMRGCRFGIPRLSDTQETEEYTAGGRLRRKVMPFTFTKRVVNTIVHIAMRKVVFFGLIGVGHPDDLATFIAFDMNHDAPPIVLSGKFQCFYTTSHKKYKNSKKNARTLRAFTKKTAAT